MNNRFRPYVESVVQTGSALKDRQQVYSPVMKAESGVFNPKAAVTKEQLAYSLVQVLGLEESVTNFEGSITVDYNGERIAVVDSETIPNELKGYVQAAIDMSVIGVRFEVVQGPYDLEPTLQAYFEPSKKVTRADYAVTIGRMFDNYLRN